MLLLQTIVDFNITVLGSIEWNNVIAKFDQNPSRSSEFKQADGPTKSATPARVF
jgi:hypothetical protein